MRYFVSIDVNNICTGIQQSDGEVVAGNVIEVTDTVNLGTLQDDFLWRKWVNGAWSVEKFEPTPPSPGPDLPAEIDRLKAENVSLNQQLAQTNADAVAFQEFIFTSFPELS